MREIARSGILQWLIEQEAAPRRAPSASMSVPTPMPEIGHGTNAPQLAAGLMQNVGAPPAAPQTQLVPTALLWLRRDLRVSDNPALVASLQGSVKVVRPHRPPSAADSAWAHTSMCAYLFPETTDCGRQCYAQRCGAFTLSI